MKLIKIVGIIIVLSLLAWYVKPVRYAIIGVGYKVGILRCPGFLDLMPKIGDPKPSRDYEFEQAIKNNCKNTMIVY